MIQRKESGPLVGVNIFPHLHLVLAQHHYFAMYLYQ